MKHNGWTKGLWLGTMNFFLILFIFWLGSNTHTNLIHADPRNFLLKVEDLQETTPCSFGASLKQLLTNDAIIYLMEDEAGKKRVQDTGRLTGWRMTFTGAKCNAAGFDEIDQTVMQFASAQGAQLNLKRYSLSSVYPETWQRLDGSLNLGEKALAEIRVTSTQAGKRRVTYAVSFTYRNIGARVEISGPEGTLSLVQAQNLAEGMLKKLENAELFQGPVPTPTVGIEPKDPSVPIYR